MDSAFLELGLFKSGLDQGWLDTAEEYTESPGGAARTVGRGDCPTRKFSLYLVITTNVF